MAIFRCNKCGMLAEQPDSQVGQTVSCPKCNQSAVIYPTLFFIEKLLEKYFAAQRELIQFRSQQHATPDPAAAAASQPAGQGAPALLGIDLGNTDLLATELQHGPIYDWFSKKQIKAQANLRGVDTSGFFDEVAEAIGGNLPLFREVIERIRWSQQKEHNSTTIHLEKKSAEDAKALVTFCQQLYDYSFVAKCFHNKPENNLRLILQTAPGIRTFFNGEWLEWHALMSCLHYAKARQRRFSCARGLALTLGNGESCELDVFMLIDGGTPICIECKSGEFRQNIDRYLALKKRLGMDGKQFIMCIAGLEEDKAKAYTAMYDLSFVSEQGLAGHLARLF